MWNELSGRQKGGLVGLAVVVALVVGYWIGRSGQAEPVQPIVQEPLELSTGSTGQVKPTEPEKALYVHIHVKGAVLNPGTYDLEEGSRVEDAIMAAGGVLTEADWNSVNLAKILKDGDEVDVKSRKPSALDRYGELIPINEASLEELETLPGIGPAMATDILRWRSEVGPIEGPQDLERIPGFGPEIVRRIAPYIRYN